MRQIDDLVSRGYLLDIVGKMPIAWEYGQAVSDIYDIIKDAPAIEAEPVVHAHWEVRGGVPYCSACGEMLNGYSCDNDVSTTPRCSFCGAKMYGGASDGKQD